MNRQERKHTIDKRLFPKLGACVIASAMLLGCIPASAAAQIGSGVVTTYDEAYYATLDYYGNLTEGSVVKSYTLNGAGSITDYGTYDNIVNLTDSTQPAVSGGKNVFDFGGNAPEHFYFEGKTTQPFEELPWTISMSYKLNGVTVNAQDLAGKTGEVEISLDFVPNPKASDYAKNNYTLEAMAMFNQDDILSLDAPGAQVQLVGNIRLVLFLCLPGEENHFSIRVGTNNFAFDGMTFLMVPATLSQLDQIATLSQRKDDLEEDYNKLSDSLDTMLDAFNGMSGSLNATANGLDALNAARASISAGKGQIYSDLDVSLEDLNNLAADLEPASEHLSAASAAIEDISGDVDQLNTDAQGLKSELETLKTLLGYINTDLDNLRTGTGSLASLQSDMNSLCTSLNSLRTAMNGMNSSLGSLSGQLNSVTGENEVTVNGMTVSQIRTKQTEVTGYHNAYVAGVQAQLAAAGYDSATSQAMAEQHAAADTAAGCPEFKQVLIDNITAQTIAAITAANPAFAGLPDAAQKAQAEATYAATNGESIDATASSAVGLWIMSDSGTLDAQLQQADGINSLLKSGNMTVSQLKSLMGSFVPSTQALLNQLSDLCSVLGSNGLAGTLSVMAGDGIQSVEDIQALIPMIDSAVKKTEDGLADLNTLNTTIDNYIPEAQSALEDCKTMAVDASAGLGNLNRFLSDLETLSKNSGSQLDAGTQQTLSSLSDTLRQAANSLGTTDDVKEAKENISSIIEDTWNEHSGDADNLLNIDPSAQAQSLTSEQNGAPQSVQILIRSQEIKTADQVEDDGSEADVKASPSGSFWSRIGNMFKSIASGIVGIFKH